MLGGPVGPEHLGKFLGPYALCSVQVFAQAVEDSTITDLGLTIALRITGPGESAADLILRAEASHLLAGKFCPIVGDNGVGKSEVAYDVLPKKLDNQLTSNFRK